MRNALILKLTSVLAVLGAHGAVLASHVAHGAVLAVLSLAVGLG
jgi:hypothetical protein